jgi:hypothetical protein
MNFFYYQGKVMLAMKILEIEDDILIKRLAFQGLQLYRGTKETVLGYMFGFQ